MFGLFSNKRPQPAVTLEDKEWIEDAFIWLLSAFGFERLKKRPFIEPTAENFPYTDLNDAVQFQKLFDQICGYWEVNPDDIVVKFFDDHFSKEWTEWIRPSGEVEAAVGLYYENKPSDKKRFSIHLAKSKLKNPEHLVTVMAHELAHVKLLGERYLNSSDYDMEPLTDLSCIFFGFGIFMANSAFSHSIYSVSKSGYLPVEMINYANALICYITGNHADQYDSFLNRNTKNLFKNDYQFLIRTDETKLTDEKVADTEFDFQLFNRIEDGFINRDYDDVISAGKLYIEKKPKNVSVLNNLGYALLLQRKYTEAIVEFNKGMDVDPFWEALYNNRGYCKLQLGNLEGAHLDLEHALDMAPENSYSWRNFGAYYLKTEEYDKALECLEKAESISPHTEMINFYLGQVHLKLGNKEESKKYLDKSRDQDEYLDIDWDE